MKNKIAVLLTNLKIKRFIKFALVGASGVGVDEGTAAILIYLIKLQPPEFVFILSAGVAIFTNFILNDIFTFKDKRSGRFMSWLKRLAKFYLLCLIGVGIKVLIASMLINIFYVYELVSNLIGIAVAMVWNFFLNSRFTWDR